jgi:hypothetical protein
MTGFNIIFSAAALAAIVSAPAAAQYYPQQTYPQQYPYQQTYPQYPQQTYPQQAYPQQYPQGYPGYGYSQGYTGNPVTDIIDQLLGNRYNVTDRQAVRRCANAAMTQANAQYGNGYNGYNRGNGNYRVTSITGVERRSYGLRVSGSLSSSGYGGYGGYGGSGYGYNNRYNGMQLSFRCNVDYNGAVNNVRVRPYSNYRSY